MQPNLLKVDLSQLLIVDMQTRLIAVMPEADVAACLKQSGILAQAAALLAVPIILTEQYPKGLGRTDPVLMAHLTEVLPNPSMSKLRCVSVRHVGLTTFGLWAGALGPSLQSNTDLITRFRVRF